ncbi:MAG TPA: fatty acid desaturase [Frankiaceae bacterium]|nr:fatty acid desaturase [Frankiaceae bacterium]
MSTFSTAPDSSAGRSAARRSWIARHGESWRDWAVLTLLNHGLLVAVAVVQPSRPRLLLFALPLAITLSITTLTVLHDAGHRQFSRREWPNVFAVQTAAPFGLWAAHWALKHRVHHRLSQVYPVDESTRSSSLVRLHPAAPLRPCHRWQHLYTWPMYGLAWLGELKSQLTYLRTGIVTGNDDPWSTRKRVRSFLAEKALFLLILIPYGYVIGVTNLVLLLVVAMTLGSVCTALVLVVGHINVGLEPTAEAPSPREWAAHLVRTTASFSTGSTAMRWLTGGMTLHLAHHLRPVAPRRDLPTLHATKVAQIVKSTGLQQVEYPSFSSAIAGHYRRLRELGTPLPETAQEEAASVAAVRATAHSVPAA